MDIGLVIAKIWLVGCMLIVLSGSVYIIVAACKRERAFDKGKYVGVSSREHIDMDMVLDLALIYLVGMFWPVVLKIILLKRKEIFA